jgi:hypothetical protein
MSRKTHPHSPLPAGLLLALAALLAVLLVPGCSFELDYDKYAVVAGISDYQGKANNLSYAAEDAQEFGDLLAGQGFEVTYLITTDGVFDPSDATYANVQTAFDAIAQKIGEDDLFLFYFSGHGYRVASASPDTTENASGSDDDDEVIVLLDEGPPVDVVYYSDDELAADLRAIPCVKRIVIIDACFSGGFIGNELEVDGIPPSLQDGSENSALDNLIEAIRLYNNFDGSASDINPEDALVIAACGERESSYEDLGYGHGVMTYFLLESAEEGDRNDDGYITVTEAYDFILHAIQKEWNVSSSAFAPHVSGGPVDYVLFTD